MSRKQRPSQPSSRQHTDVAPPLGPDLPALQQARALWQKHQFDDALSLFESTAQQNPDNLLAIIDASRALGARFEIQRAELLLNKLLESNPTRAEVWHLAGQSFRMIYRPDRARDCFERSLQYSQDIADTHLELAVMYERRHQLNEAQQRIEECLHRFPDYDAARLFLGRILRRQNHTERACGLFRKLALRSESHPLIQAQAWAELAQIHDGQEAYPEAMRCMLQSKSILLKLEGTLHQESQTILSHLTHLNHSLLPQDFVRWKSEVPQESHHRTAVLTSFPRSGTTLMEQILDAHSGLVSSDERECFARDLFPELWRTPLHSRPTREALLSTPIHRIPTLRQRYWNAMEAALQEPIAQRIHLDKNPTLTLVLAGYLKLFPETQVLFALRDPRDVLISCFFQYLPLNSNSVCFLTLERTAERLSTDLLIWSEMRDKIPGGWMEFRYEDTVHHLEDQARKAIQFLNLPWQSDVLDYREKTKSKTKAKAVGSPTYEAVQKPLYTRSIGRWKHYSRHLEGCLHLLQPLLQKWGYD